MSIQSHSFPSIWKCARVVALFKSGDRSKATNYRPICILPTLSKILERAVHTQLYQYLNENNLLTKHQFGFRSKRGTNTALSSFADDILSSMENGNLCGTVFLDLSKAFDTVNHKILLSKLSAVGVCSDDLSWFKSYLSHRQIRTSCDSELSDPLTCEIGVPQGSILGPLLFIIYINELANVLEHSNISLYADDSILYYYSTSIKDLEEKLNADLLKIGDWLKAHKLTLNIKKTKAMVIGSGRKFRNLISASVKVYDEEIETVQQYTHLGVIFTANMTWTAHIDHLCAKVNKRLGLLKRIKHLLPHYARVLYYNSLVQPLFDYGDLVWGDKNNCTLMQNLQILQTKAAKVILDRPPFSYATEALKTLGWRDLSQRRHYRRCLYIFKCVNGMTFSDLDLTRVSEIHEHNTRSKNSLRLPRVKRNWGKQRLAYHGCKDWNSLSETVRNSGSLSQFKSYFKN